MLEKISDKVPTMYVARGLIITDAQELVLVRRIAHKDAPFGQLELPGGKYNPRKGFVHGLRREVREETGLDVEPFGEQAQVECRVLEKRHTSPYSGFKLTLVSRAAITGGVLCPQPEEVSEIVQIYIPELPQVTHELTEPTIQALGFFGLYNFGNIELPNLSSLG